jgi:glycogen debranching enzyme
MINETNNHPKPLDKKDLKHLYYLAYNTILELENSNGISASGKEDPFSAFFGRDSMISCLKLLRVYKRKPDKILLRIISNTLKTAVRLQGKTINPMSGEETGKIIHEYREKGTETLKSREAPWYTYPDGTLRNYDSIDSSPLFLILAGEYYNLIRDKSFLDSILPSVENVFYWIKNYGNLNTNDEFLEYFLHRPEPYGGLANQGWMDSGESLLIYGKPPKEPVALVEVQGYYFKALRLWADIYQKINKEKSQELRKTSEKVKGEFNNLFLLRTEELHFFAQAIFSGKAQILERRSNPGHCLWASVERDGKFESVIDDNYIPDVVQRLMKPDLFDPIGGIRTLTTKSRFFDPCSYHNGSFWPFDNGLIAEGFENFGFNKEAKMMKTAVLGVIKEFNSPIELYCLKDGKTIEYKEGDIRSAKKQAWTAATILDFITNY